MRMRLIYKKPAKRMKKLNYATMAKKDIPYGHYFKWVAFHNKRRQLEKKQREKQQRMKIQKKCMKLEQVQQDLKQKRMKLDRQAASYE